MINVVICMRCVRDPLAGRMTLAEVTHHYHVAHAAAAGEYPRISQQDIKSLKELYLPKTLERFTGLTSTLEPNPDDGLASLKLWAEYDDHHVLTAAVAHIAATMDWELVEMNIARRTNSVARLTRPQAVLEQIALQARKAGEVMPHNGHTLA